MSDVAKDKAARLLKKRGSVNYQSNPEVKAKENAGKNIDAISTVSYSEESGHYDEVVQPAVQMENTFQLGPTKHFPVATVNNILEEVLTSYLQEERYEAELCRQMTKTISEFPRTFLKVIVVMATVLQKEGILVHPCLIDSSSLLRRALRQQGM
uniref:Tctex1 domain-containing protein 1 isoform X3 n=1 Tax=Geotrypetes seraphini TaxID=260995 RepID=A0A6P8PE03_GEOSA|nr:tctex1 domain-containing protein 1 isoform X3 [Geotrypetes seraphini]